MKIEFDLLGIKSHLNARGQADAWTRDKLVSISSKWVGINPLNEVQQHRHNNRKGEQEFSHASDPTDGNEK